MSNQKNVLDLFKLDGKVAYVTGGGSGLGEAMAYALAQAGSKVAVVDVNLDNAKKVAETISNSGGKAIAIKCDVTKATEIEGMINTIISNFGKLDIAVNNAGICISGPLEEVTEADWKRVIDVDLNAVFLCAQAAGKQMIKQGEGGSIVNTASMSGTIINRGYAFASYCAAKAGVKHFTKAVAVDWAKYKIRCNSISPGYMRTPMTSRSWKEYPEIFRENMLNTTPIGRVGEPEDLGGAVVYLASEASSFMTGHDLIIDGGHSVW